MLKCGSTVMTPILNKLFNLILTSGIFPSPWRVNTLSPLHKKGDKYECDNYRGIAVSSNLCKLFCSIIHTRIISFCNHNNVIPRVQIGYRKKSRTADHILTLKTLIDKYINRAQRSYLFTCFVDFKSAFDTVWRKALLYKLLKSGIGGNILNFIQDMYSKVDYCVKISNGVTDTFSSSVGVKQGCVLSPTLFNIYLSDLPDIFDESCDPVTLLDTNISCLMFADDIVLFSHTATGLQNSLHKLKTYCDTWSLTVNVNKTKIIIFNKGGHHISRFKFYLGENQLDTVQSYCYLGIIFSSSGSFNLALKNLPDKAHKSLHCLKQIDIRSNIKLAFKLFDCLVRPVLNYGCEAWAPFLLKGLNDSNFLHLCNSAALENINIKFCKYILGVHRKSSNIAVLG